MTSQVDLQVLYLLATIVTLFGLAAMAGFGLHARRHGRDGRERATERLPAGVT